VRRRIHLATLRWTTSTRTPSSSTRCKRHAHVVAQKSLAEGFGLTVAEAMWKRRPVVASRLGGIEDQIVHGQSGMIGRNAQERIRKRFLRPRSLLDYFDTIESILAGT
jgi:trehalose synthase